MRSSGASECKTSNAQLLAFLFMSSTSSSRKSKSHRRSSIGLVDAKAAVDLATAQTYSENVFLFVPNLIGQCLVMTSCFACYSTMWIGYTRIILAGLSLHYMSYHPKYCTLAYVVSCLLDAVDGQAARALGQTSKFGAVLDMVTDRLTYSLLCIIGKPDGVIDARPLACCAISLRHIQNTPYCSSF